MSADSAEWTVSFSKKIRVLEAPGQRIEVSRVFDGADLVAISRWWYYILLGFLFVQSLEAIAHLVRFVAGVA